MLNVRVAKECGVNASLILVHLKFWIEKNRTHQKHFHDGHYWTYCTMDGLTRIFEYMTASQIRTAIEKLVKGGYLLKGNYNKSAYDRTAWYALTDSGYALFHDESANAVDENRNSICDYSQMEARNFSNGFDGNLRPIPDIITDKETDSIPPYPPKGGTGDAPGASEAPVPGEPSPEPERKSGNKRRVDPSTSDDLTPDEEAMLLAFSPRLANAARDWLHYKAERRERYKPTGRRTLFNRIAEKARDYGADAMADVIQGSMSSGWKGIAWDKLSTPQSGNYIGNSSQAAGNGEYWDEVLKLAREGIAQ